MKKNDVANLTRLLLKALGENPDRQGLKKTPQRVRASLEYLTAGYRKNAREVLNNAVFDEEYDEMVLIKDIDFFSLCEHHLLPFYGKCHVAYIPKGKIIGLSKIPRIVDIFARRLQVQERMTSRIAGCLKEALDPLGVAVVIEAVHLCMAMRGVEKQNATCITSAMLGVFRTDRGTRSEFMNLIGRK
ncbi:MAG: GTP cyclohydrolase I FolE [Candidatus Omnitrophica bacterium]|nr:GTP cyclohydrolase I FolE [Candidatus Omnitrophota bacterium]